MVTAGKRASGVAAQPARKRLALGALRLCTPKGLAKIGEVGKSLDRQIRDLPASAGMQTRPRGGFCYLRVLVSRPRANGAVRAADSGRTASVHQDCAGSNRAGDEWVFSQLGA